MSIGHPHAAFSAHEIAGGLEFDLPSPRSPLAALVLAAWLAGWAVGMLFVIQQFQLAPADGDRWFLVAWAGVWLGAGAWAAGWLAWLLAGHERVMLADGTLRIWRGVLGLGVMRAYPLAEMRELRTFGRDVVPLLALGLDLAGQGASGVRFRCAGRVVRFARSLDEHAAHALVDGMCSVHPIDRYSDSPALPADWIARRT